jgi:hypothetical protein
MRAALERRLHPETPKQRQHCFIRKRCRMKFPTVLFLSVGVALLATDARADPFIIQPDGSVVLNTTLTTTGVFTCKLSQCSGSGTNTIMFENGSERASVTFKGVSTALEVTNHARPVTLGLFEGISTPGFTFPSRSNKYNPVAVFSLIATQGDPVNHTLTKNWNFGPGGSMSMRAGGTSDFAFALPDFGSNLGYTFINYHVHHFNLPSSGTVTLTADQGVVPEPGTLILVGSGLLGTAVARRRAAKRRSH